MSFVQLSQISLAFGARDLLKDITLVLTKGTKAALTGANGCGKSTLMKIIAGLQQPDSGTVSSEKSTRIAYLPQSGIVHKEDTLVEEAEKAFAHSKELLRLLEVKGSELAENESEEKSLHLADEYHNLQIELEESGWYRRKGLIDEVLRGLSFTDYDFNRPCKEFSGGWQMRIALAKILLSGADIIILDEPTNYLDIEARTWLESWLKNYKGGFLLVSHDRFFLDSTVNEIYELFNGTLKRYVGTYSQYEKIRAVELETLIKAYEQQQEEIAKTEDFIRKFRYNASKAALVQDRIKRLEKTERIEIPEQLKKIQFRFPPAPHSGKLIIQAQQVSKAYGEHQVIQNLDLIIEKGERVVFAGKNGAGKTTLLKILAGEDPEFSGEVLYGSGVRVGFFSQDESEKMTGTESIIDLLEKEAPTDFIPKLRDMLAAFLFRGDDIYKSISVLSGGEKSRLALLRLLLKPLNLLILDEPTNHLDLHSKDVLLNALQHFDATILFVSHDKDFIQNLATRVLELQAPDKEHALQASRIRNFPGSYDYYLYRKDKEDADEKENATPNISVAKSEAILSYEEQKKQRAERRKSEREEQKLLSKIEETEKEIAAQEKLLENPSVYSDHEQSRKVQEKITELQNTVADLLTQWEEAARKLETQE
ncbi:ABC transporter ATP-binding protein [Treponema phagedenis]|uniref:ABC transporter, ATP-binding protein n=1 Tax=Treponema phagedenis TaxID=162 RepID=A0A0B7GS37_TREPH|nr:ABC-F family ATP-binding cassette domain-containing protein [Treponema phagedenis]QSI00745.1 ABC transporter ATP-binding protein [Treponema phagedenis]CEM61268.1 ABC transporter, ATP-binding protein [Treponema phagedenis]